MILDFFPREKKFILETEPKKDLLVQYGNYCSFLEGESSRNAFFAVPGEKFGQDGQT